MKSITYLLILFLLLINITQVNAQDIIAEAPFIPMSPEVMGQGGSFVAIAHGYNALFYNPAGFAAEGGDFNIFNTNIWLYANPARMGSIIEGVTSQGDLGDLAKVLNDQVTEGGIGLGASGGIAYVKNGLGLGLICIIDSFFAGDNALGTEGDLSTTIALIGGYALPIELGDSLKLTIGADIRPMIRVHSIIPNSEATKIFTAFSGGSDFFSVLNDTDALHGFGIGLDLGSTLDIGTLRVGLAIRDLFGTYFFYNKSTWQGFIGSGLGSGDSVDNTYRIPMNINLGVAWHPDLGETSSIIDPLVHMDIQDIIGVIENHRSLWTILHIGAEITFFNFLALRGGFNQGYVTLGLGVNIFVLDINISIFTRELGKYLQDMPNSGITLEAAIRF